MRHSIVTYTETGTKVYTGFESDDAAIEWAEKNCEPDPRWYLTSTPNGAAIVEIQNAPETL